MAKPKSLEKFLSELNELDNSYDYSLINEYVNNNTKVKVICHNTDLLGNKHGVFEITPANLLKGRGCPKCKGKKYTSTERIELCKKIHNNKYDYTKTDFSDVKTKTIVTCPIHGDFITNFDNHFNKKNGCKLCINTVNNLNDFIINASLIHNNKYDYSTFEYINSHTKGIIICPIHGEFKQIPNAHLRGQGCPECGKNIYNLEVDVENYLNENNIIFEKQKRFEWLGKMSLDFYLPEIYLAIECQGKQHFGMGGWSKNFNFDEQKKRDEIKYNLCKENNINIIYYTNINICKKYFSKLFFNIKDLLTYVKYLYKNNENN